MRKKFSKFIQILLWLQVDKILNDEFQRSFWIVLFIFFCSCLFVSWPENLFPILTPIAAVNDTCNMQETKGANLLNQGQFQSVLWWIQRNLLNGTKWYTAWNEIGKSCSFFRHVVVKGWLSSEHSLNDDCRLWLTLVYLIFGSGCQLMIIVERLNDAPCMP